MSKFQNLLLVKKQNLIQNYDFISTKKLRTLAKSKGYDKEDYDLDDLKNWLFYKHNLFIEVRVGSIGQYDEYEVVFDACVYDITDLKDDFQSPPYYNTYLSALINGIETALKQL